MSPTGTPAGTPKHSPYQSSPQSEFHEVQHDLRHNYENGSVASYQHGPSYMAESLSFIPSFNHNSGAADQHLVHYGQLPNNGGHYRQIPNHSGFQGRRDVDLDVG